MPASAPHHDLNCEMKALPWDEYCPSVHDLNDIYRSLQQPYSSHISHLQSVFAHIVLKIHWESDRTLANCIVNDSGSMSPEVISKLFAICVRMPYELPVAESALVYTFFGRIYHLHWHMVSDQSFMEVLNWVIMSSQPSFVLQLGVEVPTVENCMLKLFLLAAEFTMPETMTNYRVDQYRSSVKRRHLISSIFRMFGTCNQIEVERIKDSFAYILDILFNYYFASE